MQVDLVMPKCGLTMREGTIVRWIREEGDVVADGEAVLEIETEKALIEVPAPDAGKIVRRVAEVGAIVPVGDVLAVLEVAKGLQTRAAPVSTGTAVESAPQPTLDPSPSGKAPSDAPPLIAGRASPVARRLARELGVDVAVLVGTGARGLVTEADIRAAAAARPKSGAGAGSLRPAKVETLRGMRKAIASSMSRSVAEAPQVTLSRETGMAGASALRQGKAPELNITDILVATVARVLGRHPRLNAHLVGDELRFFETVNIALAVAIEDGLVAPVLRDAGRTSLEEIAILRTRLVKDARERNLRQSDLEDGTFTITNLGAYGIDAFTPILSPPQVAILGIGAIRSRPAVVDQAIVARETCVLSLTFDHRALDGAPAALFLSDLSGVLADPARLEEALR